MTSMSSENRAVVLARSVLPKGLVIRADALTPASSHFDAELEQLKREADPQKRLKTIIDLLRKHHPTTARYATVPSPKKQKTEELEDTLVDVLKAFRGPPELIVAILELLSPKELAIFAQASADTPGARAVAAVGSATLESVMRESDREESPRVGMSLPLFVVAVVTGLVFGLYIIFG